MLSGRISPDSPSVATLVCDVPQGAAVPRRLTDDGGTSLAVRYAGTDRDAIREAVRTAPFGVAGVAGVAVVAAYFEVKFPDRPRSESWACDGTLFALAEPQWLVRVESFVVGTDMTLWGPYDPDEWLGDPRKRRLPSTSWRPGPVGICPSRAGTHGTW